jgi:hypothetical protein
LAHWNKYLDTGQESSAKIVLQVCDYILENTVSEDNNNVLLFKEYVYPSGFIGKYSGAMEQGLGAFILAAGYEIKKDPILAEAARRCIEPLKIDQGRGISVIWDDLVWFEEFPDASFHVLNGCLDAVIGIWASNQVSKDVSSIQFLDSIFENLTFQAKKFDRGWWSNYWSSDDSFNYIASMKYHTIHVFQLRFLAKVANNQPLLSLSNDFERYSKKIENRMLALVLIVFQKLKMSKK